MILAAVTPLLAVLGTVVVLRLPAAKNMPLSLALTAGTCIAVWAVLVRLQAATISWAEILDPY